MNTGMIFQQYFDDSGKLVNAGKLYSYVAETSIPKALYADKDRTIALTNPVELSASARSHVFYGLGLYRLVLTDANDILIDELDNVEVTEAGSGPIGGVTSVFGRDGAVEAQTGDYTYDMVGAEAYLNTPYDNNALLASTTTGTRSWIAPGDLNTGFTSIKVNGLMGKGLPALDGSALLKYNGSNWTWDTSTYQTKASNLDALSAAVGDGFFKRVSNVWTMDNTNYLTQNQSITVSGDVTGTGNTSIDTTVVGIRGYSVPSMSQGRLKYTVGSGLSWESKVPLSAGVTGTYPTITRGTTTISVGAFSAYLYPNSTFQGDPILYSFPATNNINIPMVNDGTGYIIVDYFNGEPYVHLEYNRDVLNYSNKIPIAMVWNVDNTEVHFQSLDSAADGLANKMQQQNVRTAYYQRDNVTGGLTLGVYTYSGPTYSLKPTITDGLIWSGGISTQLYNYSANDGNKLTLVKLNSTGNYDYITTTDGSGIDNTHYNTSNNQWLTMSANKYRKTFLFRSVGDALQCFYMVGVNQHNTVAEAESEAMRYIPSILVNHCMYVGYIIIQCNVSTPVKVVSAFLNSGTSGGTVISDHTQLSNLNSTSYYHLTQTQYNDLTDGGSSDLHYHANMVVEGGVWA